MEIIILHGENVCNEQVGGGRVEEWPSFLQFMGREISPNYHSQNMTFEYPNRPKFTEVRRTLVTYLP